jgi:hypothetical protein
MYLTALWTGVRLPPAPLFLTISIMINLVKDDNQIQIKAMWTPQFKAEETPRERQDRHEKHQAMLEEHKEKKALAREKHKAGWHKFKITPNTLI